MEISLLRIYLVGGLLLHKMVWELLKMRQGVAAKRPEPSLKVRLVSAAKLAILFGILVQTVVPEVLPLAAMPALSRALGFAIYTAGLLLAITARVQLGKNWSDIEKSYVLGDHALVAHGVYRYIRHPIYAGDVLLLLGLELTLNSWLVLVVVALAIYVRRQAIREERALRDSLPGYDQYCRRTARFLPFLPV